MIVIHVLIISVIYVEDILTNSEGLRFTNKIANQVETNLNWLNNNGWNEVNAMPMIYLKLEKDALIKRIFN